MAIMLFQSLFLLPLLFASGFAQFNNLGGQYNAGGGDGENAGAVKRPAAADGNDGGLPGDVAKVAEAEDNNIQYDDEAKDDEHSFFLTLPFFQLLTDFENRYPDFETDYTGDWELVSPDSGVSAMHMQLMPNNKVLIFDTTTSGPSQIKLPANRDCFFRPATKVNDCWAHSVEFDIETGATRPLTVLTDPWCSSGGLASDGTFLGTGGFESGVKAVRSFTPCDDCDWEDTGDQLADPRWYATQAMLADGSFIVVGGRRAFSYEYIPANGKPKPEKVESFFLQETTDLDENNLYPFVNLLPDGNLFIFANSRSIILNPETNEIVRELPRLAGGSRNYPASASSALLPLHLDVEDPENLAAEVMICGGNRPKAYRIREDNNVYLPALQDCVRLIVSDPEANWKREKMPTPRVMGDMLILPTADLLLINGAKSGVSAWNFAEDPNYTPLLYKPYKPNGERFKALKPTNIARMYHSSSAVLPDGKILVAGSNTHPVYTFQGVTYPTEMRVEKFSPPYLAPEFEGHRPNILADVKKMEYGKHFYVDFVVDKMEVDVNEIKVTILAPPFTTHGYSMNQRLLSLKVHKIVEEAGSLHALTLAPHSGNVAPPGYYLLFVVYRGVPSVGKWVQID